GAAGEHLADAGVLVDDRSEDEALQLGRALPIVGIGFEHDLLVALPELELEGTAAAAMPRELLAVLLDRGWRNAGEAADRARQHGEHRRIGRGEVDGERVLVDRL